MLHLAFDAEQSKLTIRRMTNNWSVSVVQMYIHDIVDFIRMLDDVVLLQLPYTKAENRGIILGYYPKTDTYSLEDLYLDTNGKRKCEAPIILSTREVLDILGYIDNLKLEFGVCLDSIN